MSTPSPTTPTAPTSPLLMPFPAASLNLGLLNHRRHSSRLSQSSSGSGGGGGGGAGVGLSLGARDDDDDNNNNNNDDYDAMVVRLPVDYSSLVNNTDFSDVRLLCGPDAVTLHAHASILALRSDFFRLGLASHWHASDCAATVREEDGGGDDEDRASTDFEHVRGDGADSSTAVIVGADEPVVVTGGPAAAPAGNKKFKTFKHPEIEPSVMLMILEYLYTGHAKVQRSDIFAVARAADLLLLPVLVKMCLSFFEERILQPENALSYFKFCEQEMINQVDGSTQALHAIKVNVPVAIFCGRQALADLSVDSLEVLLSFSQFDVVDKWSFLVSWIKASQGFGEDLTLDVSTPLPEDADITTATEYVERLVPRINVCSFERHAVQTLVVPHLNLLPDIVRQMIRFQYRLDDQQPATLHAKSSVSGSPRNRTLSPLVNSYSERPAKHEYAASHVSHVLEDKLMFQKLKAALQAQVRPIEACTRVRRLFRFSEHYDQYIRSYGYQHTHDAADFALQNLGTACVGVRDALVLVQVSPDSYAGAYVDAAWPAESDEYVESPHAFVFYADWMDGNWSVVRHGIREERASTGLRVDSSQCLMFGEGDLTVNFVDKTLSSTLGASFGPAGVEARGLLADESVEFFDYEILQFLP